MSNWVALVEDALAYMLGQAIFGSGFGPKKVSARIEESSKYITSCILTSWYMCSSSNVVVLLPYDHQGPTPIFETRLTIATPE